MEGGRRIGRMEARLLLQQATGLTASALLAHPEWLASDVSQAAYRHLVGRRAAGEPVAYLLGWREFYGHEFRVAPGVLIPRPETELLVEQGLTVLAGRVAPRVLDLGCGSGCIGLSLALARPDAEVWAVDVAPAALALAQDNAAALGVGARWRCAESDWLTALPGTLRFDLIVSNPPYIAASDPHLGQGDLRFEPPGALASGADGLDALRQIIMHAHGYLQPDGWLWLEHGHDQAAVVRTLLEAAGYCDLGQQRDLAGILRISGGRIKHGRQA